MLRDNHNRFISYLRISVTERCNFRCVYCMPAEGIALAPKADLLTFEEITRVAEIARRDVLPAVLRGIDAAIDARLTPIKLNAVVMRGVNDDELCDLVDFAHTRQAQMRFIEYMPMGEARRDDHNHTVPAGE